MKYSRFDVIVANFPFIENIENAKARPAVVISSDIYNAETGFVVIAMITSAKHSRLWGDIKISDHKMSELHSGIIKKMGGFFLTFDQGIQAFAGFFYFYKIEVTSSR